MTALPATHDLGGFVDTLELLIVHARRGRLVAASINLNPNGMGHYAYKLLDGIAPDVADPFEPEEPTSPTQPGKRLP